jgi:hypothetical protein
MNVKAQEPTITMPVSVAKQIAQDLLACDSVKDMLFFAEEEVFLLKEKIEYKDSVILNFKLKEINLKNQVSNQESQKVEVEGLYTNCKTEYQALAKKEKTARIKNKLKSIFGIPVIIALGILYILK